MKIKIKDVAARAGVSPTTVSYVLNGKGNISAETREKVLQTIEELHYIPDTAARRLRSGNTHLIGMIMPTCHGSQADSNIDIASAFLNERGYHLIIFETNFSLEQEKNALEIFSHITDGVILNSLCSDAPSIQKELPEGFPVVVNDCVFTEMPVDCVGINMETSLIAAVRYLKELGHTTIGFHVGPDYLSNTPATRDSCRIALEKAGLPYDPALVLPSRRAVKGQLLENQRAMEQAGAKAFVYINHSMMVDAFTDPETGNFILPDDIDIVSVADNPQEMASITRKNLSWIVLPLKSMMQFTCSQLLEQINGTSSGAHRAMFDCSFRVNK